MLRILTDRGSEYCGNRESHEYALYLDLENVEHTRTKARSPQTNGICERFHQTMAGKQAGVAVIPPDVRVQDVINQLETDDVSALVVSDDGRRILRIISAGDIVRGLKTFGRDVGGPAARRSDDPQCHLLRYRRTDEQDLRAHGLAPDSPCANHPKRGALQHHQHAGRGQVPPR